MKILRSLLAVLWFSLIATPALAHHPGTDLDKVMGSKETFFQIKNKPAPDFTLGDPNGNVVRLTDLHEKVIVLHFIYTGCPDVCPLHAEKIAEIQAMINRSPMKDMVRFITITTDPLNDTPDVLKAYGTAHGLDAANWAFLTAMPDQGEDATRTLAKAYGHKFIKTDDGYQVHGVVTHVIDRNRRWAANFHGLRFGSVNMVLYVNGLINNAHAPSKPADSSLWEKIRSLF